LTARRLWRRAEIRFADSHPPPVSPASQDRQAGKIPSPKPLSFLPARFGEPGKISAQGAEKN